MGNEQVYLHAQKDFNTEILNDQNTEIDNDQHLLVDNDQRTHIKNNHHILTDGESRSKVTLDQMEIIDGSGISVVGAIIELNTSGASAVGTPFAGSVAELLLGAKLPEPNDP